ncbi:multicopper oxidase [Chaetomium fimeti]|uniref:Multicopper oxidase n=1 Tax=Chaetomium fimeti TaxID=1854472 RepID=A0AAE0LPK2_9PEZI|nr:multicopper oxidase [Chaetomium fimeti]
MARMNLLLPLACAAFSQLAWAAKVHETLRLTWEEHAPNGQARDMILMNGQFPGPQMVWTEDDDIEVVVHNDMPMNATVHWHGIAQTGTPWSDGVIGLSQQPIQPGESFVYRFKASPPGTHWYHSHEHSTFEDGLYGAIFVEPKKDMTGLWSQISEDPEEIEAMNKAARNPELLVLSDWSSFPSEERVKTMKELGLSLFCVDSILVNGHGEAYCPPHEFLIENTNPTIKEVAFPDQNVTEKGCLPLVPRIQGDKMDAANITKLPGYMHTKCSPFSGSNYTVKADPADGWISLNLIGAESNAQITVSIDEHPMWLYEVDGGYVEPQEFVSVLISSGQRFSVLVKLDKPPADYTIRLPDPATQVLSGFANLVYKGAKNSSYESKAYVTYNGLSAFDFPDSQKYAPNLPSTDKMKTWPANPPALVTDEEYHLVMGRTNSSIYFTMMNQALYYTPASTADQPMLHYPNSTLEEEFGKLVIQTRNGSWVDVILEFAVNPGDEAPFTHIMHKHGNKMWKIGEGEGPWNYTSVAEAMADQPDKFNLVDPGLRDTWLTPFAPTPIYGLWSVYRYHVTDPGAWLYHCHLEQHLIGGMGMVIMDGVDAWPEVPAEYAIGPH